MGTFDLPNEAALTARNPFTKGKDFNLTYQMLLEKQNPALCEKLKAQAGITSTIQKQLTGLFLPGNKTIAWPQVVERMGSEYGVDKNTVFEHMNALIDTGKVKVINGDETAGPITYCMGRGI